MGMWIGILSAVLIVFFGGMFFIVTRIKKFFFVKKLAGGKKLRLWLISAGIAVIMLAALSLIFSFVNAVIIMIHLVLIWALCELGSLIVRKVCKKSARYYFTGITALIVTFGYLTYGWIAAHNVVRTYYSIESDKVKEGFRLVQFSDSHMGAAFDAEKFSEYVDRMQSEEPDAVLITGDFVDDGTTREEMIAACRALSDFHPTFGIYFCFGNHDKGYFNADRRGWTAQELKENLEKNGVIILEDESVAINDELRITGRKDASEEKTGSGRMPIDELLNDIDIGKFDVVMDHQPNDYENESQHINGLVVSGHTHGGQFFPVTHFGEWIGANDRTYGYEKRNDTHFIVSSGIADWELKFKTGCISEYVVIDVT